MGKEKINSISTRVIDCINYHFSCIKDAEISDNCVDDLGLDSLDMVELVMAIEEEFSTVIIDKEWETVITVENIIDLVRSKQ